MVRIIENPTVIASVGTRPKRIAEYAGRVTTGTDALSLAVMQSPSGWEEPGQTPQFDEYTLVLRGAVHIATRDGTHVVRAGQLAIAPRGEWVRYSTPEPDGAEYVAVCLPAFSPATVHRDA